MNECLHIFHEKINVEDRHLSHVGCPKLSLTLLSLLSFDLVHIERLCESCDACVRQQTVEIDIEVPLTLISIKEAGCFPEAQNSPHEVILLPPRLENLEPELCHIRHFVWAEVESSP